MKIPEPLLFRPNSTLDVACAVLSAAGSAINSAEDSGLYSLRPIDSHDLTDVRRAFSLGDKSGTHGILEYISPFLSVALVAAQKMIVNPGCQNDENFWPANCKGLDSIESKTRPRSRFNPLIHTPNVVVQPIPKRTNK
jgi:hypothetical protein